MIKVIKLKDETWERLRKFGEFGDTNDSVVRKVIELATGEKVLVRKQKEKGGIKK
jgi:hypothetical protein